jgi:L-ascorbate metabolism protein UlaG (beta-lactamase superfamily)
MEITYLGHASFLLKTKDCKVLVDPFDPKIGLPSQKMTVDVVTISHHHFDHNFLTNVQGEPMVFDWPGEYEKNGVRIFGIQSYHDKKKGAERGENVIFRFEIDDISIVHLGDQGFVPDDKLIEDIGEVDVLMIPVGGATTIGSDEAAQTIKHLDPGIIIPMHYATDNLSKDIPQLEPVENFIKKMNVENVTTVDKLVLKKEDLADKDNQIIVMKVA